MIVSFQRKDDLTTWMVGELDEERQVVVEDLGQFGKREHDVADLEWVKKPKAKRK
ncbi:hypothetical protein VPHD479_0216 [Vibrio phage D479]